MKRVATIGAAALLTTSLAAFAGQAKPADPAPAAQALAPAGITPPADYVIGIGDVLMINYWKEPDMSIDSAIVRPDGMITLPLINDVPAMGLKPDQLSDRLATLSRKAGLVDPRVTVGIRAINSRKVYIWGGIAKPGPYDLLVPTTVLQLISIAGGPKEFVDGDKIVIIRTDETGKQTPINFNLKEVQRGRKLEQNIPLKPGDVVTVPE
jgi:polysaccharide biosynthesis/export protein